jgi:hypothetical protein
MNKKKKSKDYVVIQSYNPVTKKLSDKLDRVVHMSIFWSNK